MGVAYDKDVKHFTAQRIQGPSRQSRKLHHVEKHAEGVPHLQPSQNGWASERQDRAMLPEGEPQRRANGQVLALRLPFRQQPDDDRAVTLPTADCIATPIPATKQRDRSE